MALEALGCIFGAYFEQFSLSSPDVNKNKGMDGTAPLTQHSEAGTAESLT